MTDIEPIIHHKKVIGYYRSDGIYITHRNAKHFFIKYNGFGLSSEIITLLKKKGCKKIVLIYERSDGTQKIFETYPNKFFECGEVYLDGDDYQRILPVKDFNMDLAKSEGFGKKPSIKYSI